MIIKNIQIYREDKKFHFGDLAIEEGRFVNDGKSVSDVVDGNGAYAIPGLIDLHFHGCMGYDFCDGTLEAIQAIAKYEASIGVTSIAPATMTLPVETLEEILRINASYENTDGARLVGINMEGPFISKEKKGAQDATNIIPYNVEVFRRFQKAAKGLVKFIGIAPEYDGAIPFIQEVKGEVSVSLAHTNANYEQAKAAFDNGASHVVHLHNAMPAFSHREPGVVGAAFDSKHVMVELICDGVHIHPSMVRATFEMFGADRIILISDSMRAAGMADGRYTLGGLDVDVKGNRAALVSSGALAGSVTNLMDCMKTAVIDMGIPLEDAIACATMNPARALKIDDKYGSIASGKIANLVLLDKELNLQKVIING